MSWLDTVEAFGDASRDDGAVFYTYWEKMVYAVEPHGNAIHCLGAGSVTRAAKIAEMLNEEFAPEG